MQTLDQDNYKNVIAPDKNGETSTNKPIAVHTDKLPAQCCANCFCDCKMRNSTNKENSLLRKDQVDSNLTNLNKNGKQSRYTKPRICMITGGVELVPLLARRRSMQRPISLSTTDVTKYPTEKKYILF